MNSNITTPARRNFRSLSDNLSMYLLSSISVFSFLLNGIYITSGCFNPPWRICLCIFALCLSVSPCLLCSLCLCLFCCLYFSLSLSPFLSLCVANLFLSHRFCLTLFLCSCLSPCLCFSLPACLSVSLSLSFSVSFSVTV